MKSVDAIVVCHVSEVWYNKLVLILTRRVVEVWSWCAKKARAVSRTGVRRAHAASRDLSAPA